MTTYIKIPFASSGDKTNPPDTDAAGGVNWTQGYPIAYSKDPATDPSAKRIEREIFNGLMNRISTAINEIQMTGVAPYITAADNGGVPFAYSIGAMVNYNNNIWISRVDANTTTPSEGANWTRVASQLDNLYGYKLRGATNFEASTTYTIPSGVRMLKCIITGGGGGGSGSTGINTAYSGGGGGGGGATLFVLIPIVAGQTTATITVGGGGLGTAGSVGGGGGGSTRISYNGVNYGASGGDGGGISAGGSGSASTTNNGYLGVAGGDGIDGNSGSAYSPSNGGASYWGGGGRAGTGGGLPGKAYGSGGGGAYAGATGTNANGANGRGGVVVIEEYY